MGPLRRPFTGASESSVLPCTITAAARLQQLPAFLMALSWLCCQVFTLSINCFVFSDRRSSHTIRALFVIYPSPSRPRAASGDLAAWVCTWLCTWLLPAPRLVFIPRPALPRGTRSSADGLIGSRIHLFFFLSIIKNVLPVGTGGRRVRVVGQMMKIFCGISF